MLAADHGQWPFRNPLHSITAAQRQYIAAVREETEARKKKGDGPVMSREEWQQVTDLANANRQSQDEGKPQ